MLVKVGLLVTRLDPCVAPVLLVTRVTQPVCCGAALSMLVRTSLCLAPLVTVRAAQLELFLLCQLSLVVKEVGLGVKLFATVGALVLHKWPKHSGPEVLAQC